MRKSWSRVKLRKLFVEPMVRATLVLIGAASSKAKLASSAASSAAMPTICTAVAPRLRNTAISLRWRATDKPTTRPIKASRSPMIGRLKAKSRTLSTRADC